MDDYNYFGFHKLNQQGQVKADYIANEFEILRRKLDQVMTGHGRAAQCAKTKLEEACFFAKKAMATDINNQED